MLIVIVNVFEPVPPALVALIVAGLVAAKLGVPEITPVVVFTIAHEGSPVALNMSTVFVAVI